MTKDELQALCEEGQRYLQATEYLDAEAVLARAESVGWAQRDWDTLARLYMPLQEARRQRRQKCSEGRVGSFVGKIDPDEIVREFPSGTVLVASDSIHPALRVREIAGEKKLYLDVFLGTVQAEQIRIIPGARMPEPALVFKLGDEPSDMMGLWERLHGPFLAAADAEKDPVRKIEKYRDTIEVDYACELAHQRLADVAHALARRKM